MRPLTGTSQPCSDRLKPNPLSAAMLFAESLQPRALPSAVRAGAGPGSPHPRPAEPPRPGAPSSAQILALEVSSSPFPLPSLPSRSPLWGDSSATRAEEQQRQHRSSPGRPGRDGRLRHVPSSMPRPSPAAHAPRFGAVCSNPQRTCCPHLPAARLSPS